MPLANSQILAYTGILIIQKFTGPSCPKDRMKETDSMILFWGGPFSQWYPAPMVIDGTTYWTAEQWMMACKARHFKDDESLVKIMAIKDPSVQKQLGRKVKGFDAKVWEKVCQEYVYIGNLHKFTQTPGLKGYLIGTKDKEIVEASPYDKIWGIGLGENDPDALDKSKWQGQNLLGIAIMRVRKELMEDESLPT